MSSVDLPDPDGPRRPTASPRPILVDISEYGTRVTPPPSERLTPQRDGGFGKGCPDVMIDVFG